MQMLSKIIQRTYSPEGSDSFFFEDSENSVEDVLVVSSLFWRQSSISSHPDQSHFGGVSDEGAYGSGGHSENCLSCERRTSILAGFFEQPCINAQSCCGVTCLSGQPGRKSIVDGEESFVSYDTPECMDTGPVFFLAGGP